MTRFKKIVFLTEAGYTNIVYHFRPKDKRLFIDSIDGKTYLLTSIEQKAANTLIDNLWEVFNNEQK